MASENEKNEDLPSSLRKSSLNDEPPPYDTIAATVTLLASINDQSSPDDEQQAIRLPNSPVSQTQSQPQHTSQPTATPPLPRVAPPARPHKRSTSVSSVSSVNSLKAKKSWFSFTSSSSSSSSPPVAAPALPPIPGSAHSTSSKAHPGSTASSARTQAEVRQTVSLLIADLIRDSNKDYDQGSNTAALGILASCAEVCRVHAVPFADMLQEKSVEGHSPVYWAVVKRPRWTAVEADAENNADEEKDLIAAMLCHIPASSLHSETAHELRLACLATSDQNMYRRLLPFLQSGSSLSSSMDAMILGSRDGDDITVLQEHGASADGKFAAKIKVVGYHTRMMVKREIDLEFIARNRIWRLTLLITPDDAAAWRGPLPGTWCIAFSLQEPSPPTWVDAELFLVDRGVKDGEDKVVGGGALPLKSKQMLEAPRNGGTANQILVPLDKVPFAGLQYSGALVDDTLRLLLEVRLRRPDPESL